MSACKKEVSTVIAAIAVGTFGGAVFLALPGLVGALRQGHGFTSTELGYFSFAHLTGLTLGSAAAAHLFARIGLRRGTLSGLILASFANGAAVAMSTLGQLVVATAMAGFGAGIAIASSFVVLSRSKQVDRNFGIYTICQLIFGAAALHGLSSVLSTANVGSVFAVLSVLFAVALLLVRYLPPSVDQQSRVNGDSHMSPRAWAALAGILMYFIAQGAVWAYLELIGQRWTLERRTVASVIAFSTLAGLMGALAAVVIGPRFGRAIPLLLGRCMSLAALYAMLVPFGVFQFIVAACLFSIAWNFSAPYQLSAMAAADTSGRAIALAASATLGGLAIGPIAGALALEVANFDGALYLSAFLFISSYIGLLPAMRAVARNG